MAEQNLTAFVFEVHDLVRAVTGADGEPWFVGLDGCRALGIKHHQQALRRLKDSERGVYDIHTPGGPQTMIIVSEPGLYRLIFSSKTPQAERFKDWVYHEVLPSIRRTGIYRRGRRPGKSAAQVWTDQRNAACRIIDAVRRTQGVREASAVAITVLGELGYHIGGGSPDQGELDLKVVGGTDAKPD